MNVEELHREEVNLRRLLACSEKLVQETDLNPSLPDVNRLHLASNIIALRQKLALLQQQSQGINHTRLSGYSRRINDMAACIDETQLLAPIDRNLSKSRITSMLEADAAVRKAPSILLTAQRRAQDQQRQSLVPIASDAHRDGIATEEENISLLRKRLLDNGIQEEVDSDTIISKHRERQAEMTSELVRMAGILKEGASSFNDRLVADSTLIGEVQDALSGSLERLQKEGSRLGRYASKASKTTILTWSVLLFVCLTFVITYMAIRILPKPR